MNEFSKNGLTQLSPMELLRLHSSAADELKRRKITRSSNNPAGDLAEYIYCSAFDWKQAPASMAAADAVCSQGIRYQIKSRRLTMANGSRQLSAIRNLNEKRFDFLAGVLFDTQYAIQRAAIIPYDVVVGRSSFQGHTNSALFMLAESVWDIEGVVDVTMHLRKAALELLDKKPPQ